MNALFKARSTTLYIQIFPTIYANVCVLKTSFIRQTSLYIHKCLMYLHFKTFKYEKMDSPADRRTMYLKTG